MSTEKASWLRRAAAVVLAAGAVGLASEVAGANSIQAQPLPVTSTSLAQNGQDLVWSVQAGQPFSPAALARNHRSLCLLIERPASGSLVGQLCVIGPARHARQPRLEYAPPGGRPRVIAASITRASDSQLSASFLPTDAGWSYRTLRWHVQSCGATATLGACAVSPSHLLKLHTPKLVGCVPSGPSLVFHGPPAAREIALTFDDGPWPDPPSIDFVNLLARYHVPATFFEIGEEIPMWDPTGSVERKMLADGDMIGDHTWNHPDMVPLSPAEQTSELERASAAIRHATGFTTCLWKPPYGDISPQLDSLARSLGFLTIYWDVDTVDWSLPGTATIVERAISGAHNGAIIEMHFGGGPRYETLDALPQMIDTLRARGYKFENIAQMLGLRLIYK